MIRLILISIALAVVLQGCGILSLCMLAERHARAEEKRTGIKREFKVVEPWEGKSGD